MPATRRPPCSWQSIDWPRSRGTPMETTTHAASTPDPQRMLSVRLDRGRHAGAGDSAGYLIPWRENQTILDVVTEIQRTLEPTLAYRFACRVGVCGSRAMTANRTPRPAPAPPPAGSVFAARAQ